MAKKKNQDYVEIGSTGLERFGGYIQEEYNDNLRGKKGRKIYEEMSNDSIVGAILFSINMLIRKVSWNTEAISNEDNDIKAADFLQSCINGMSISFGDVISEILSMLIYGWCWMEVVYIKRDDGNIGWRKMSIRAQNTLSEWVFDEGGGIQALKQQPPPDYLEREIPIEKSLLFRTTTSKGNPEGKSILRSAYKAWYFKNNIENIEAVGVERDLAGLPVMFVPKSITLQNASSEEKTLYANIRKIVSSIKNNEQAGLVLPSDVGIDGNRLWDFKLVSSGGARNFNTTEIINRYKQEITMSVLADFILLGHEKVGSFALASSKTTLFATAISSWLDSIATVFNKYAIPRLFNLNKFNITGYPKLIHGDIESVDLGELGEYISKLAMAGIDVFDKKTEEYLKRQANLPTDTEL